MKRRHSVIYATILFFVSTAAGWSEVNDSLNSPEQKVISKAEGQDGFFRKDNPETDRVVMRVYSSIAGKKPDYECTVRSDKNTKHLADILKRSPVKGDVFKKLSPRSTMITVEFYNGINLVGEAKIYNDELQMPDTSFLNEKNQSAGEFVMQVKHTIELRRKAVATIARLRKEISASGNGMISLGRFSLFSDDGRAIRFKIGGWTKAIVYADGNIISLNKSRQQNQKDVSEIEELIDSAGAE